MKWCAFALFLWLSGWTNIPAQLRPGPPPAPQRRQAPRRPVDAIVGTVTDVAGNTIRGATVTLLGPRSADRRTIVTGDNGFFQFKDLTAGIHYRITISARGFASWTSPAIVLKPDQYLTLDASRLQIAQPSTALTVTPQTQKEIARRQVREQEQQRIGGILPNFLIVLDPKQAVPLTPAFKFRLALRTSIDPITIAGVGLYAAIDQAVDRPDYGQGWEAFGKRTGVVAANGFTDIMIGGAVLPSLLKQDPRYFYQGKGGARSRALHAISAPFVCPGDNGRMQPNYSTVGGVLASSALADAYYPAQDRGPSLLLSGFLIGIGERVGTALLQEFVLGRITSRGKKIVPASPDPAKN